MQTIYRDQNAICFDSYDKKTVGMLDYGESSKPGKQQFSFD